ncbi:phosphoribosyl-AMP cyclohydrolase [Yoonia sp. F2084L]|uniref:phosphoribosyl-AMP cyclohydrolase n=1 Tax=Yoonia sp. F2084L TaxID=2926419 RepID=UPI001FF1E367|nr:phosphoribosyl-AMP cyclohydrolase [Yoonia sp. F2084L]MCK0094534.1 phosphoribosyl-AMP cyclohydrolase [Yoonia sp. F2084L]
MPFDPATLRYNDAGLIPAIAQDATTGEVLMMAWMNAEAVAQTLQTGRVTYWSRSRQEFWIKGATSGHTQELVNFRVDCDRDCLLVTVNQTGAACHTGRRTCFYTEVQGGDEVEVVKLP